MNADNAIQTVFSAIKNIKWRDCEENDCFEWYYAEDMHYVIRKKENGACWFVKAKSPEAAYSSVMRKIINV